MLYKNNKLKITAPTWNEKFELPDGLYSISSFQYYFEYIVRIHKATTASHPIWIYVKKIENRIKFKFKAGFMKLLGSTKN